MKNITIISILLVALFLSGCSNKETACNCQTCPKPEPEKTIQEKVIEAIKIYRDTADTRDWDFHFIQGNSMEEYGFHNGSYAIVSLKDCQVDDFCVFQCLSEKCAKEQIIKKVIKQDGNKYWFQGNEHRGTCPEGIVSKTNCSSFDSRDYGWLVSGVDFKFIGTTSLENQKLTW